MQKLANGLTLRVYDQTKVYFGDYHHVRLNIVCSLEADSVDIKLCCLEEFSEQPLSYSRTLGKMGVASKDVVRVKTSLLKDFQLNALPYIASPEFPQKMIECEIARKKLPVRKYSGSGS